MFEGGEAVFHALQRPKLQNSVSYTPLMRGSIGKRVLRIPNKCRLLYWRFDMRKALATLGVLAVLLFASAVMTGCEKSDDGGGDNGGETDTTEPSGSDD